MVNTILDELESSSNIVKIGCSDHFHKNELTIAVVTFYLICRMHFISAEAEKEVADKKKKRKQLNKLAKQR